MSVRMTAEEEKVVASEIIRHEQLARDAMGGLLHASCSGSKTEKTRAGPVQRLTETVEASLRRARVAQSDPDRRVVEAEKHLKVAEGLCWRLVFAEMRIARHEARRLASNPFMGYEDLVQEGVIGLLRAARRFEPDRSIRFSTYARWWVTATQIRAIENTGRPIRLPGGASEQARQLRRAIERFQSAGIDYSVADLAEEMRIEEDRVKLLLDRTFVPIEDCDELMGSRARSGTMDVPPDLSAITRQGLERMWRVIGECLDERERLILKSHYGLDGEKAMTMAEIGKKISLSRERVRQIEVAALNRLRGQF